ncbi:MAG: hypothetical protein JWQ97_921 [Phenylobacterium sp.]|nr:hypothetical protein [Phenylobacterium sp.]
MPPAAAEILRREGVPPDAPGGPAALLEPLFLELGGAGAGLVSLTIDYGAASATGGALSAEAWIDRATRTLVFAHGRIVDAGGGLLAAGSAVLKLG